MPRPTLNKNLELFSHLSAVAVLRDKETTPFSSTLSAAGAVGDATLTCAAITNAAVSDLLRLGYGEEQEYLRVHGSTAPSGSTVTLEASTPLRYAHAIGDPVVELEATDPGQIDEAGVEFELSGDTVDVNSATERLLFGSLAGHARMFVRFGLLCYSVENIAMALGMTESTRVTGSGTSTAQRILNVDFTEICEVNNINLQFTGATKQGKTVRITCMGCELDPNIDFTLARGQKTVIPMGALVTGGTLYETW
jgi:hypothetical protein